MNKLPLDTIIQGDTLDVLKTLPSDSIDLVFADPPFNVGKNYGIDNDRRKDYFKWCDAWLSECFRTLKNTGSIYVMNLSRNIYPLMHIMEKYGIFRNLIIWKNNGSGASKRNFWTFYQPILFYSKSDNHIFNTYAERVKKPRWSPRPQQGQLGDIWDDIPFVYSGSIHHPEAIIDRRTNKKLHPAQMPERLARRAILFSTNEDDTVMDPFVGSGTTAVAAKKSNCHYIGIDNNPEYVKLAKMRLANIPERLDKFGIL